MPAGTKYSSQIADQCLLSLKNGQFVLIVILEEIETVNAKECRKNILLNDGFFLEQKMQLSFNLILSYSNNKNYKQVKLARVSIQESSSRIPSKIRKLLFFDK